MVKQVDGNFSNRLLRCPYCPEKINISHRTACYKVKMSQLGRISFRCVACGKVFYVKTKGKLILKDDNLKVL